MGIKIKLQRRCLQLCLKNYWYNNFATVCSCDGHWSPLSDCIQV